MADAQLIAQLKLDASQYNKEMKNATDAAKSAAHSIDNTSAEINKLGSQSNQSAGYLKSLTGAVIGYVSAQKLIAASDEWTTLNNRIRLVTSTQAEFAAAQSSLVSISQGTGQALNSIGSTYQALARSQKELGLTQKEVLQLTDTISKTMVIGGGTAEGNAAALIQLSQALSSGVLRGEEFNSVMEQAPALAKTMAEGLGVPVGALRQMANDGKLTADAVSKAILKMSKDVDSQFKTVDLTISQSLTVLNTGFTEFIGKTSDASGAASRVSGAIQLLGKNIDLVANSLMIFAGIKLTAMAVSATIALAKLSATYVIKTRNAALAAKATEGTALAITQASLAAWRGAPAVTTFAGSLQVLAGASRTATASVQSFSIATASATAPLAALTFGFTALGAASNFMQGKSAENWVHGLANSLAGLDNETESLGTKLADLLNDDYGNFSSKKSFEVGVSLTPIGQSKRAWNWLFGDEDAENTAKVNIELPSKGSIEIQENVSDIKKQFTELSANIGLSSEQIKINTANQKIAAELAKTGNSEATIATLKRAEADAQGAQAALDKYNADKAAADEVKKKTELEAQNARYVQDTIEARIKEAESIGMTKEQLLALELSAKGATAEQIKQATEAQKLTDTYQRQNAVMQTLESIMDSFKTAGMSGIEKQLYQLQKQGATREQLEMAKKYLEATEVINETSREQSRNAKEAKRANDSINETQKQSADTMLEAANLMNGAANKEDVKEAKKTPQIQMFTGAPSKASDSQFKAGGEAKNLGEFTLNLATEKGLAASFPMLGSVKSIDDLRNFFNQTLQQYAMRGSAANS